MALSSTLGDLAVNLHANTAEFESDMGKAAHIARKEMLAIERTAKLAGAALGGIAVAGAVGLATLAKRSIEGAAQLATLSSRTGLAVEALSEMKFAADQSDLSMGQLSTGVAIFNKRLLEAQDASSKSGRLFTELGVNIKGGPHQALLQFGDAIRHLSSEAQLGALRQAFGNSGPGMREFVLGLRDSAEEARKMGQVISTEFAKDAKRFDDNLDKIGKAGATVGTNIGSFVVGPLANMSEQILEAHKNGGLLLSTLRSLAAATGSVPGALGMPGRLGGMAIDQAMRARQKPAFQADVRAIDNAQLGPKPDEDAIMCTLSGGAWVNGRCLRKGDAEKAQKEAEFRAKKAVELQEMAATDTAEAWEAYANIVRANDARIDDDRKRSIASFVESAEIAVTQAENMVYTWDSAGNRLVMTMEEFALAEAKSASLAKDLGLTFSSAFEDAIVQGKQLREVLQGIGQDIARIIVRRAITEPAADELTRIVKGFDLGNFFRSSSPSVGESLATDMFGGADFTLGFADGGRPPVGRASWVGERGPELFVPDRAGTIVPNEAMGGMNVNISVQALDGKTAAHVIASQAPVIMEIYRRAMNSRGVQTPVG